MIQDNASFTFLNRIEEVERCYIQSAISIDAPDKKAQEIGSLIRIPYSFRKIVVVKDYMKPWRDEHGILYVGVEQFLLDEDFLSN